MDDIHDMIMETKMNDPTVISHILDILDKLNDKINDIGNLCNRRAEEADKK